ncbi:MAG: hypothetical protein J0L92_19300 [Deltaproteobacteria bacterium]|nr:hypothetical protein [Deltaproteobacteria bacterium]
MTTIDPLLARSTRSWTGDPHVRLEALLDVRASLVDRGRLVRAPFLRWLGESIGDEVFEACVRADLTAHAFARKAVADEALCVLLDVLEESASLRVHASAHDPAMALELVAHALEQRFVARWASVPLPPIAPFTTQHDDTVDEAPSPRPLESVLRRRLAETG